MLIFLQDPKHKHRLSGLKPTVINSCQCCIEGSNIISFISVDKYRRDNNDGKQDKIRENMRFLEMTFKEHSYLTLGNILLSVEDVTDMVASTFYLFKVGKRS